MDYDCILDKLKKIKILPTFPNIVAEVLSVIEDPMSSATDLAKHMDPSMVGEILRIANSAYFGTRNFRGISAIEHAIAVIGYEQLSYIILQMPFIAMVGGNDKRFDRNGFNKHSIICGALSNAISSAADLGNPNETYISGVMHDIGIIILYRYFQDEWRIINSLIQDKQISRLEAEREVLSVDHGYVGAMLLGLWNIPKPIIDGVMFHHNPENAEENRENAIVTFLSNTFAKQIDIERDLADCVGFIATHKDFIEHIIRFKQNLSPTEEIKIFEKIYSALKSASKYIEGITEKDDD